MNDISLFPIQGFAASGFEPVKDAFTVNFTRHGDRGASFCVIHRGKIVVDLYGGSADRKATKPWRADTLVNVWSTTKGLTALAMHVLADRGLLDFKAPVAQYWPEFARHGKETVLVEHVLSHSAGLPAPSMQLTRTAIFDWERSVRSLEDSELWFEPGKHCSYHPVTYGTLAGEVLRRITGVMPGDFFRSEITTPLQAEFYCGLREDELPRVADMITPRYTGVRKAQEALRLSDPRTFQLNNNLPIPLGQVNSPRWRMATMPGANGHGNARGLASVYAPLSLDGSWNGVRILSEQAARQAGREFIAGMDLLRNAPMRRGLGFELIPRDQPDQRLRHIFGHGGWGGSNAVADPVNHLAIGYAMRRMIEINDVRMASLLTCVYDCLEQTGQLEN